MLSSAPIVRTHSIVLHVTGGVVEALVPRRGSARSHATPFRLVRFEIEHGIGAELAEALVERLRAHGVRPRSAVLALGPDVVASQVLELPPLAGRNLEAVVGRRAAGLLDLLPDQTAYSAIALDGEDVEERRWLVHATDRRALRTFQTEMRRAGFPVASVLPARTAPYLSDRCSSAMGGDDATLVALFESDASSIGLISGDRLVQLSILPGGATAYVTDPNTARSFVQELRGIDAFWRRRSRGERVGRVIIGGVEQAIVRSLEVAIQTALGDVEVRALDVEGDEPEPVEDGPLAVGAIDGAFEGDAQAILDDPTERARIALLASFRTPRLAALDMAVELPPRRSTLAAVATGSLFVWGALGASIRAELESECLVASVGTKVAETAAADFEQLTELESIARAAERQVFDTLGDLESASDLGVPFAGIVVGLENAFEEHGVLLTATAVAGSASQGQAGALRLRGAVVDELDRTSVVLESLEQRLRGIPGVTAVSVDMPSLSDHVRADGYGAREDLGFSAVLTLRAPKVREGSADLGLEERR
ncbi:MAG: hypothetical protein AAFZ87_05070 [Planctomycetota bacterium]